MRRLAVIICLLVLVLPVTLDGVIPSSPISAHPATPIYQNLSENGTASASELTITAPAGFGAGDLFVVFITKDDDVLINEHGDWTTLHRVASGGQMAIYCAWRKAEAGDTSWTWTGDAEAYYGAILRFTGQDATTPINISDVAIGDDNTPIAPDVETTSDDCIIFQAFGADDDDTPYTVPGAPFSQKFNDSYTTTGGAGGVWVLSSQGLTGAGVFGMNAIEEWGAVTVAIQPPSAVVAPTVVTNNASSIEETTATLSGNITATGGENCTDRGFQWDIDTGVPYTDNWTEAGNFGTGVFTHGISGLTKGELYYYIAGANNTVGWGWGSEVTFLTKPDEPTGLGDSSFTNSSIFLEWNTGTGSQKTMVRYRTDQYPTDPNNGTQAYFGVASSYNVTALDSGQKYYISAWSFATEGGKEQYSDLSSDDIAYTLPGDPSNLDAHNPSDSSIDLEWTEGAGGDKTMIRRKEGSFPTDYNDGVEAYFGTDNFTTDSGLSANITYFYGGWAFDSDSAYYSDGYTSDNETTLAEAPPPPPGGDSGCPLEGCVYLELRAILDESITRAFGKPTHTQVGIYTGYSLPIYNNDNEELFMTICVPDRWNGESNIFVHLDVCVINANQKGKRFNIQLAWEQVTADVDVMPVTSTLLAVEQLCTSDLPHQTYQLLFEIDYDLNTPDIIIADDLLALRIRRIVASQDYITGEVMVYHCGVLFMRGDLLGEEEGMTEAIFFFGFVLLAIGLLIACYAFKKPVLGFGAAGGWLLLGFYAYGYLTDLGIVYWGVRGALFFICMGLVFISVFEAMGARGKREIGDDYEVDDRRTEEEKEVDEMISESEESNRPAKKLRDYYGKNKKNKKKNRSPTRKIARQEARKAMERGD